MDGQTWRILKQIEIVGFWKNLFVTITVFQVDFVVSNIWCDAWEVHLLDKKLWFHRLQEIFS